MPEMGRIIGAEGRHVFTPDPVLNLWISVYLLAIEDSLKADIPDIPYSTDSMTRHMIKTAPDWLESDAGKAVYNYIMEGLANV